MASRSGKPALVFSRTTPSPIPAAAAASRPVFPQRYMAASVSTVEQIRLDINWDIKDFKLISSQTRSISSQPISSSDIGMTSTDDDGEWFLTCHPREKDQNESWTGVFISHQHPSFPEEDDEDDPVMELSSILEMGLKRIRRF